MAFVSAPCPIHVHGALLECQCFIAVALLDTFVLLKIYKSTFVLLQISNLRSSPSRWLGTTAMMTSLRKKWRHCHSRRRTGGEASVGCGGTRLGVEGELDCQNWSSSRGEHQNPVVEWRRGRWKIEWRSGVGCGLLLESREWGLGFYFSFILKSSIGSGHLRNNLVHLRPNWLNAKSYQMDRMADQNRPLRLFSGRVGRVGLLDSPSFRYIVGLQANGKSQVVSAKWYFSLCKLAEWPS